MDFDELLEPQKSALIDEWSTLVHEKMLDVGEFVSSFRGDPDYFLVSKQRGSFNFSIRMHWNDENSDDWLIRFPIPGRARFVDEKYRNEVAVMNLIRQNTAIP